jgi:WD40 repeat protein
MTDSARSDLPLLALIRFGTDQLRTENRIKAVAFSPDGRLVAAGHARGANPAVALFDVGTGRQVKQLVSPVNHGLQVESLAFSPDGTKLLWGESEGAIVLWDLSNEKVLFREQLHERQVKDVGFSPDGRLMAGAGGDVIRLHSLSKPNEAVRELSTRMDPGVGGQNIDAPAARGQSAIACLAFSPDGARLAAGSDSGTLFVWHTRDGKLAHRILHAPVRVIGARGSSVSSVAITPDGRRIMTVGQTTRLFESERRYLQMSALKFWDIESGAILGDYHGEDEFGFGFGSLSNDGRLVAIGDFSRLRILDAATGRAERTITLPGWWGDRPAFSPEGTLVAVPIANAVGLFKRSTGRRLFDDDRMPLAEMTAAAWSPSGDRIATCNGDGFVRVWDAASGKVIWHKLLAPVERRTGWSAFANFLIFSRDGKLVVAAGRRDDAVQRDAGIIAFYEAETGRTVREVMSKEIRWAALAPDGRMLVVATAAGGQRDVHFIGVEVATGRTRWATPREDGQLGFYQVASMRFEPKPPWFIAALGDGNVIRLNALTGHEERRFVAEWRTPAQQKAGNPREPYLGWAALSDDGRTLVSMQMESIQVWDVETGTLRRKFPGPRRGGKFALAPDSRTLATAEYLSHDDYGADTIRLFDIETGKPLLSLEPADGRAAVMAFSPDSGRLFTGFGRGTGVVWEVKRASEPPRANDGM